MTSDFKTYREYGVDIPIYGQDDTGPFNKEEADLLKDYLGCLLRGMEALERDKEDISILKGALNLIRDLESMVCSYEYDCISRRRIRSCSMKRRRWPRSAS